MPISRLAARKSRAGSEPLDPRPELELPCPGAARLPKDMQIVQRDRVGIEHRLRLVGRFRAPRIADRTVDDEVGDMDALGGELTRHALRQPAQRKLAHRERRRLWIAFYARRGAGEQHRAMPARQHPPYRLLTDQERTEGACRQCALDLRRLQIDERPAGAGGRVVDHDIGDADPTLDRAEQPLDLFGISGIASNACAPVTSHKPPSLSGLRAAKPTAMPSRTNNRASEALRPEPAPTMGAVS